jgi:hypothetical protein
VADLWIVVASFFSSVAAYALVCFIPAPILLIKEVSCFPFSVYSFAISGFFNPANLETVGFSVAPTFVTSDFLSSILALSSSLCFFIYSFFAS